jgi:hypothetical protein
MKVLIFGATGMVGQGVLRECLRARDVEVVQTVGRTRCGQVDPRLVEVIQPDMMDYRAVEASLEGFDACFFCLGVSSAGMREAEYTRLTYDLTMAAAQTLARLNPQMTFVYVSGANTDSTERGRSMWARVKGRTENALQLLPFKAVYLFRPGDPAVERRPIEDALVPAVLRADEAVPVDTACVVAQPDSEHRGHWSCDAGSRPRWRAKSGARNRGHSRAESCGLHACARLARGLKHRHRQPGESDAGCGRGLAHGSAFAQQFVRTQRAAI